MFYFPPLSPAGVGLAGVGLLIETLADEHKLAAKRESPRLPVMDGLFGPLAGG